MTARCTTYGTNDQAANAERATGRKHCRSEPECAKTYASDSWEHTAFWAAAWMHRLTGNDKYSKVRMHIRLVLMFTDWVLQLVHVSGATVLIATGTV